MHAPSWRLPALLVLPAVLSCSRAATGPELASYGKGADVPGITTRLEVSPNPVTVGDSVEFRAWARNATDARVQVGQACGPAMDVVFSRPGQEGASALYTNLGSNGAFTCELAQHHFAEPRDSLLVRIRIAAPAALGTYEAIAGLRRNSGLSNLSASVTFDVR